MANSELIHRQPAEKLNGESRGLILFERELESWVAEEIVNGEQVKAAFAEMYPPTSLFSSALQMLAAIRT